LRSIGPGVLGLMPATIPSNFTFLKVHDEQLVRFGMLAEKYFPDDPNTCLLKLRQFGEVLAQLTASRAGLYTSTEEPQSELLRRLQGSGVVPRAMGELFYEVKNAGNAASHRGDGDHRAALATLGGRQQTPSEVPVVPLISP
jgi:type I restriction enzyme, R subunit